MITNIVITHGPVVECTTERAGEYCFRLEDGATVSINFMLSSDGVLRKIKHAGKEITDNSLLSFIYSIEDAVQWTIDNWCEIAEVINWMEA